MDREALLKNASGRLIDAALDAAESRAVQVKSEAASAGRSGSSWSNGKIEDAFADGYQQACISVLDKIQLEDRDNALEIAERFRRQLLEPAVARFAEAATAFVIGKRPDFRAGSLSTHMNWDRQKNETSLRLRKLQANVVEEFQLAVTRQSPQKRQQIHIGAFVDPERIEALRAKSSIAWDFGRLIALCEELNTCWLYGAHHAVAMLTRSLLDHVPPIFGQPHFSGVANNYSGGKSFGDLMKQLDKMSRAIADGHLHTQIRNRESLPNATQVDCRPGIDALLAEIIRTVP